MLSRGKTAAAVFAAVLATAPAINIGWVGEAAAQTQGDAQAAIAASLKTAAAAIPAGASAADRAAALAAAVQSAVVAQLQAGASADAIAAAVGVLVASGVVNAAVAAQGVAQAAAQIAADPNASAGAKAQAMLVTAAVMANDSVKAGLAAGGSFAAVRSTGGAGGVTVFTDLAGFLAGVQVTGSTIAPNNAFNPCAGVVADYC